MLVIKSSKKIYEYENKFSLILLLKVKISRNSDKELLQENVLKLSGVI